jgi:hypothetical protein
MLLAVFFSKSSNRKGDKRVDSSFVVLFYLFLSFMILAGGTNKRIFFVTFPYPSYSINKRKVHKMETANLKQSIKPTFNLLRLTFSIVPVVAGLDKFTNFLTDWEKYLHPGIAGILPFAPHTFMMIVGVVEIIAGIIVLARPAMGGNIVAAWLTLIAITLVASGNYLDVAVRDLVMAIGAFSMARIAKMIS